MAPLVDLIPVDAVPSVRWAPTANTRRIYDRNVFVNDTAFTTPPVVNMVGLPVRAIADEVTIYPKAINAIMLDPTGTSETLAGIWYVDVMVSSDPDVAPNFLYVTMTHPSWSGPETRIVPHGTGPLCWTDLAAAAPETPTSVIFIGGGDGGAPVLTIGTVTEGATPSVTAIPGGTPGHYTLNFVLKPGSQGLPGTPGSPGATGQSAYAAAVAGGYSGTLSQWIASLKGAQGDPGTPGAPGTPGSPGATGLSAYQVAQANGFAGTQAQWLLSLVGPQGAPGTNGTGVVLLEAGAAMPGSPQPNTLYLRKLSADTTPPSAPTGLNASSVTSSSFTLNWTAGSDNVAVDGYEVQVDGVTAGTVSALTMPISGKSPSTAYTVRVRTIDTSGNTSTWTTITVTTSASADSTAPTVPTGVTISAQGSGGFTVSWTASTDNIAVTGYEVQVNGVAESGIGSTTSKVITGKSPSTTYAVRVRARDAAGNWSALSTSVDATTTSAGSYSTQHTVFGSSVPSGWGAATLSTDGTPDIELGHGFYKFGSGSGWYANMRAIGMRIYKPAGVTLPVNMGIKLYTNPATGGAGDFGTERLSKLLTGISWVDGWNSFYWDTAYTLTQAEPTLCMYRFTDTADRAKYLFATAGSITGSTVASDGTKIALSENGSPNYFQNKWRMGSGYGVGSGTVGYNVDIIVDEGAP